MLLSDSRASGALLHSGSTKVTHLEEVNASVRAREGVKVQLLCSPPKASSFSPWKRRCPAALDPPKTEPTQTKPKQQSAESASACLVSAGTWEFTGGGAGSVLSCLPWGHLPLTVILIYTQAFNRILIGCVAALNDSVSARTWYWWVFVFAFLFFVSFCTLTSALSWYKNYLISVLAHLSSEEKVGGVPRPSSDHKL